MQPDGGVHSAFMAAFMAAFVALPSRSRFSALRQSPGFAPWLAGIARTGRNPAAGHR